MYWWQTGIIYQIYPRSFQDSRNAEGIADGVGDLNGIRRRLDYLQSLNVDAIWISPIYPSPMHDFGYDVANYCDIHPLFGTLDDFDRLLAEAHDRGLRVVLDLVPNHTSDEHPWFVESRSSRDNAKRDYYLWRDPAPGDGPPETRLPNNWETHFGGPAWTYDAPTGQFYMHQFHRSQPELNYRHPEVLPAMLDNMRFWLDRGVDGFRVDVIWLMLKDEQFRDEPLNPQAAADARPFDRLDHIYTAGVEGIHDIVRVMRAVLDEYDERMMVGEIYLPLDQLMTYYGDGDECHMPFNFRLINLPWDARLIGSYIRDYEAALPPGGWPNWVLGNHDQHRVATRVRSQTGFLGRSPVSTQPLDPARAAQMLLLTLRGTPTCYYGDEIGMEDVPIPFEQCMDPAALQQPELYEIWGRDPERTPMQWDASPNAGFTGSPTATPWLPLAADYAMRNVAAQDVDPASMLTLFRRLTALRRAEPALHRGDFAPIDLGIADVLAYRRTAVGHDGFLVVINFGAQSLSLNLRPVLGSERGTLELSTDPARSGAVEAGAFVLLGHEGVIIRLAD
jgi:alpha-glucosidase